jgi:hypothetical protein
MRFVSNLKKELQTAAAVAAANGFISNVQRVAFVIVGRLFKGPSPLTRFRARDGANLQMDALLCRAIVLRLRLNMTKEY